MRAVDIIINKRDKKELTGQEIDFFVEGYCEGTIPDYQASAWAMAVLLNGMTPAETTHLTMAFANSGETLDLTGVVDIAVDKHSTGGVGDKTTLVVEPLIAACGLPVGKMSGRGLGFSGGTLDKMESIPGFRTNLSTKEFLDQLCSFGLVLTGPSKDLAPADAKLYALRDVTGTVQSMPLIASSVMSKKIASGAQAIVLDVKVGNGAFMETVEDGRKLAEMMVSIARLAGRKAVALLSDMNQPLGCAVGNALEVKEAIQTLQNAGPADFVEHCLVVAAQMLMLGGKAGSEAEARQMAELHLQDGSAWDRFRTLVKVQGGDVSFIDQPNKLAAARLVETQAAEQTGYIAGIHARLVGEASVILGAGRAKKDDLIDHAVGIEVHAKVGDLLQAGDPVLTIHANDEAHLTEARSYLSSAVTWSSKPVEPLPLFYGIIG